MAGVLAADPGLGVSSRVREIRSLVTAGQAGSVSAFVQHAVGVALHDAAGWREMLDEALQQTGGMRGITFDAGG